MAILVTGGAGFIGSHIVEELLERGDTVVCVDNLNEYYDSRRKQAIVEAHSHHSRYSFYKVDITDRNALAKVFMKHPITTIIHVAAQAGVRTSIKEPELYLRTNVIGTLNVLELAREHAVLSVVAASSSSVYGTTRTVPFHEGMKLDEQISPYAVSKKAMENLCYQYSSMHSIPITCVRFFTVYGPRGRPDMAPHLFMKAILEGKPIAVYGDGTTSRDYTYVTDIARGVIAAHDRPKRFAVYNLGNNTPVSLNEFIATMEKILGKKAKRERQELQPGDVNRTWADISRAKREIGYEPKTDLEEGLRKMYTWYRETKDGALCEYKPKNTGKARVEEFDELYQKAAGTSARFSFGRNWEEFVTKIDERHIAVAERSLLVFLGSKDVIKGKTFIDVGCGSGIFSLAALRLGAKHVVSIDPDQYSIRATTQIRNRFGNSKVWTVKRGSILDRQFVRSLGTFDIVYSWGSLHHTGNMRVGLENVDMLLKESGLLYLGIYNDNTRHHLEGTSRAWMRLKAFYNRLGNAARKTMQGVYTAYLLTGITLSGHNPVRYVRSYHTQRGMDFSTDIKDWLGGYPYEYASTQEIIAFYRKKGYDTITVKEARSLGCNEFLFVKR